MQQRQLPVVSHSKQAYGNHGQGTSHLRYDRRSLEDQGIGIEQATNHAGQCVNIATEDERHLVDQNIAQDATGRTRTHAHDVARPVRETGLERLLEANDRKQTQSDGIEQEDGARYATDGLVQEDEGQQGQQDDEQIDPLCHPERTDSNEYIS